jgi:glycosyltransferase involved in cell wall biosynthesis
MAIRHSTIIPMLNGAYHVQAAIASALVEAGVDDEVLFVDNGSTDGSAELVRSHDDPRVKLLCELKRGPAAARNHGLEHASGELISFLDHDDLWPSGRQRGLMDSLTADPTANAAYGRLKFLFETVPEARFTRIDGTHVPALGLTAYMFRRELIERAGRLNEDMIFGEDQDYVIRLREAGMRCAVYEGVSAIYRRHAGNMTRNREAVNRGVLDLLARHIARKRRSDR